jgi:hypothetical protein
VFDVLAGRPEDLPIEVHLVTSPESEAMPSRPADRPRDGVSPRVAYPLVQIKVAHGVRDDGRAEHHARPSGTSVRRSTSGSASAFRSGAT